LKIFLKFYETIHYFEVFIKKRNNSTVFNTYSGFQSRIKANMDTHNPKWDGFEKHF